MKKRVVLACVVLLRLWTCCAADSTPEGWWPFQPPNDPFDDSAMLDLRALNEKVAGQSGWVRSAGGTFVLGNGKPVRFWGANAGKSLVIRPHADLDYLAKRLAKCGVNLLRVHAPIWDTEAATLSTIDTQYRDALFYFESVLKKQGIYTELSFYSPLWIKVKPSYGLEGYETAENNKPFALLFFDPQFQQIYRGWARELLAVNNPYTGLPLGKDPAVAVVEVVNEDGYLFSTFDDKIVPAVPMAKLERKFGAWLSKRYGTIDRALAAWGDASHPRDDPSSGQVGLYGAMELRRNSHATNPKPAVLKRSADELRFLTDDIRQFYSETIDYFHETLGVQSLVSCGNWRTVDPARLESLERYATTVGDVLDRHGYYFAGKHDGPNAKRTTWKVSAGDTFVDRASVTDPFGPPVQVIEYGGYPMIVSELGYPLPNRLRADNALVWSAYASLQGVDGIYFFALNGPSWVMTPEKFPVSTPSVLGQFPAAALQYRRGDVDEAPVVVRQVLNLDDLCAMKGTGLSEAQHLDALRAADLPPEMAAKTKAKGVGDESIDPYAFFVGRVQRVFGQGEPIRTDLRPYIDARNKIVKSITGQVVWDYGRGLVRVDTKRSQAVAGFLSRGGAMRLGDVTIESANDYGAIQVISLDGRELASARKILVQAFTQEEPSG